MTRRKNNPENGDHPYLTPEEVERVARFRRQLRAGLGLGPERDPDLQFKVGAAPPSSHAQEGLIRAAFYRELPLHQWAGTPETEEEES